MTNERYDEMLSDLLELENGLTAWELDFIDNLDRGFRNLHGQLRVNSAQKMKLEEIWNRRVR